MRPRWPALLALSGALCWLTLPAWANDRPFQNARTAIFDDDSESWSFETWVQRLGRVRGFSVEPEYTFTPQTSVQMELSRLLDKGTGADTGHEAEIEFKHLFKDITAAGWGYGLSLAFSAERSAEHPGTQRATTLKLPLSFALGSSGAYLHVNAGVVKVAGERRVFTTSAAAEFDVSQGARGFVEFARTGERRFGQFGVRHWLRHDKLALDIALQHSRQGGEKQSGFIIGLGFSDI